VLKRFEAYILRNLQEAGLGVGDIRHYLKYVCPDKGLMMFPEMRKMTK
jgi:hypothetical protein